MPCLPPYQVKGEVLCAGFFQGSEHAVDFDEPNDAFRQCDRVQPGCSQCARKMLPCPGYRDTWALRVHNETEVVVRKAQKAQERKEAKKCRDRKTTATFSEARQTIKSQDTDIDKSLAISSHLALSPPLRVTADDAALSYFMSSYILSSPFESYLPKLYIRDPHADDALSSAVCAASFATFYLRTGEREFMDRARFQYAITLGRTNMALTDRASAVLDRTLAAILLMGLFESIVYAGKASPREWTAHIHGALRLLQLRGLKQFESDLAPFLFSHVGTNIRTSCIQRSVAVPVGLQKLCKEALPFLDGNDPATRFIPILDKAALIGALIGGNESAFSGFATKKLNILIRDSVALDREAAALINESEEDLAWTVRSEADTPPWAYRNIAYHYQSHRAAKFWNGIRMCRLYVNNTIFSSALAAMDRYSNNTKVLGYLAALQEQTLETGADIATQVLACAPDFIDSTTVGRKFVPAARNLVWPLSLVSKSSLCPRAAKAYALSLLIELGNDLNLPPVLDAALLDDKSGGSEDW